MQNTVSVPYRQSDIINLEKIQRRAARYVTSRYRNCSSVNNMIQTHNWKSLEQCRKEARLAMLYKISVGTVAMNKDQYLKPPSRYTRHMHSKSYQIPTFKTDYRKYSFFQ